MDEQRMDVYPRSFKTLEVGRAFAALLVVAYHALDVLKLRSTGRHLFTFGYSGVDFFFVLSGFIIFYAHRDDLGRPERVGRYLWKRFSRIYPIYWVVFAALATALFLFPGSTDAYKRGIWFLLRAAVLIPTRLHPLLGVTWSLSYELVFYLVFAIIILNKRVGFLLGSLWIVAVLFGHNLSSAYPWVFLTDQHILEFGMGVACALSYPRLRHLKLGWLSIAGLLLFVSFGLANSYLGHTSGGLWDFLYGIASVMIVIGCTVIESRSPVKVPGFLLLLGAASYSIYLVHYPVLLILARLSKRLPLDGAYILDFILAVLAGVLFHKVIERPLYSLLGKKRTAESPSSAVPRSTGRMEPHRTAVAAESD